MIGLRLKHARRLRKLTQVQLATQAGVKQASISEIETGASKSLRGATLLALSKALRISPTWLATGTGHMDPAKGPLPDEALQVAQDWLTLAPEIRQRIAAMIREMASHSTRFGQAVADERVEAAFGRPPTRIQPRTTHRKR